MQNPYGRDRDRAFSEMVTALADMVLNDPTSPEELKLSLRLLNSAKDFQFKLNKTIMSVTANLGPLSASCDVVKGKRLLEYLCLMEAGFDSFLQTIGEN